MKLGTMQLYNEVEWAEYAIDQATKLCDKLIIFEGSQFVDHPEIPERSIDGTYDIIKSCMNKYPDFITLEHTNRDSSNYRINQCNNFNISARTCAPGGYLIPLDADEFYDDSFIDQVNQIMEEGKVDLLKATGKLFAFSFGCQIQFNKDIPTKDVFYKINKDFHFIPTHKPVDLGSNCLISHEPTYYHYTWVKNRERMMTRMNTSGMFPGMKNWFEEIWDGIPIKESTYQYFNGEFHLSIYKGIHPSILVNHKWRNVPDVRDENSNRNPDLQSSGNDQESN